jgi:acetyl esterase/lipase
MNGFPNHQPFTLSGRWRFRLRNVCLFLWVALKTVFLRLKRGPLLPNWTWTFELGTRFVRDQYRYAFALPDINDSREFLDALVPYSSALEQVKEEPVTGSVSGSWFSPETIERDQVVLYLHGGGYCFNPMALMNMAALLAVTSGARTFYLDYRLSPEHSYPAQLEDALKAYQWILESETRSKGIILAGDSAGGNLCLALLLTLRHEEIPLPMLTFCLSPWTDIGNSGESMIRNEAFDLINKRMCDRGSAWFLNEEKADGPSVSPLYANFRDLPPIYVQAGSAEIFVDMIEAFAERAKAQEAKITLEVWENMNHVFPAYGDQIVESRQAWKRLREVIGRHSG